MPHLVQMDKRYGDKGLTIIADEVQGSSKDAIEKITRKVKAEFPITRNSSRPPTLQGIPHAVVFDSSGKLVFAGHPGADDFDRVIKKALKDVEKEDDESGSRLAALPEPVIPSRTWTNAEGRTMTASVLAINGDSVRFKLANGKAVDYPVANLSEEDQAVIKEAAAAAKDE